MPAADAPALQPDAPGTPSPRFPVQAWLLPVRLLVVLLLAAAVASLSLATALLVHGAVSGEPHFPTPLALVRALVLFALLPFLLSRALRRLCTGTLVLEEERAVLQLRWAWYEIPYASLAALLPWRLPLPGPGLRLRLASGRTFRFALGCEAPAPLVEALAARRPQAAPSPRSPALAWAQARASSWHRRPRWLLLKYGLFPLLPTAVLFRAHQYIAYGGPLGEYHLLGLKAYLRTLAVYWAVTTAHLVLYAAAWRALAEGVTLAAAWLAPGGALRTRRAVEWGCALVYFAGIPGLLLLYFL